MTPRAGAILDGRYELVRQIAVGGMGQVWGARELGTNRTVAVKVLRPEFAGEKLFLDRIATEARNSAHLNHPGIAQTLGHGQVDGLGYLVMELVDGEPLSDILARHTRLSSRLVLELLSQTADALAAAHAAGVVHRDIKPANLLVSSDGTITVTDFGISLGLDQAPMTSEGMVMGTAQYLPPEQAMGRAATGAGDLYALGVIAYEALAGKRPFTGTTQVDIAFAHVTEAVPPLPETVDPALAGLILSLLEKDPANRPSSATEVARHARRLLDDLDRKEWNPAFALGAWNFRQGAGPPQEHAERREVAATADPPSVSSQSDAQRRPRRAPRMERRRAVVAVAVVLLFAIVTIGALLIAGNLGESAASAVAGFDVGVTTDGVW